MSPTVWSGFWLRMISSSNNQNGAIERAQPWLGTLVHIRVQGMAERGAHRAIDSAFQEIATVHRLMSFHESESDLSRLNRARAGEPIQVHPYTCDVLRHAAKVAAASNGCFDVTVGAELVEWQLLPRLDAPQLRAGGSWEDIALLLGNRVVLRRPLCIDLGGIAKGYAVDRATDCLVALGATQTVVNAGGDIRVHGPQPELVQLSPAAPQADIPVLELRNGSVASSSGHIQRRLHRGRLYGPHVDGVHRAPSASDRFVSVTAARCITADALTKVVMAQGHQSQPVLRRFHASAYFHEPGQPWQQLETESDISV